MDVWGILPLVVLHPIPIERLFLLVDDESAAIGIDVGGIGCTPKVKGDGAVIGVRMDTLALGLVPINPHVGEELRADDVRQVLFEPFGDLVKKAAIESVGYVRRYEARGIGAEKNGRLQAEPPQLLQSLRTEKIVESNDRGW